MPTDAYVEALDLICARGAREGLILQFARFAERLEIASCRRCGRRIERYPNHTKWWHVDDDQSIAQRISSKWGSDALVSHSRGCRAASFRFSPVGYDESLDRRWVAAP